MLMPWAPYPLDGGSKRAYSLCRLLGRRFRFSLLTFRPRLDGPAAVAGDLARERAVLRPVFEQIHWVEPPREPGPESVAGLRLPADARRFYSAALALRLAQLAASRAFDLLHVEFDLMAAYGAPISGMPKVLTQHDMGGASLWRSYLREMSGWSRLRHAPEWLRRRRFTRRVSAFYDRVVTVTEKDAALLRKLSPGVRAQAVPTGVDLEHFRPEGAPTPARLVYVGHYPHYPNEEAAVRFCRSILPRVRARRPDARFYAVGSDPTEPLRRAAAEDPTVVVTGTVPDVKPFLAQAAVFVAPIRLGEGIKGKILEAFAMGVPVVASSRAAEGLGAKDERELLVADSDRAFARAVVRLLDDAALRLRLGESGRAFARERYDWPTLAGRLGDLYDELF